MCVTLFPSLFGLGILFQRSSSLGGGISGDQTHPRSPADGASNREKDPQGAQSRWRPRAWDRNKCNLSSLAATSASTTSSAGVRASSCYLSPSLSVVKVNQARGPGVVPDDASFGGGGGVAVLTLSRLCFEFFNGI